MNKYISSMVLFFSCAGGLTHLQGEILVDRNNDYTPGTQWTAEISKSFNEGKYTEFLGKLEARYEQGEETQEWESLKHRHRKGNFCHHKLLPEGNGGFKKFKGGFRNYRKAWALLKKERNGALAALTNEYPDIAISKVIQDFQETSSENSSKPCKRKEFKQFKDIRFKARVMNKLLSIATFEDDEKVQQAGIGKIPVEDNMEYSYILGLYEFKQMEEHAGDQDDLQSLIKIEKVKYDVLIANLHNEQMLIAFAKEQVDSQNVTEKKIVEIINTFENQRLDLLNKFQMSLFSDQQMTNCKEKS